MARSNPTSPVIPLLSIALAALLSGVGWIVVKVWDMAPTVSETARRVDRIVEALPEVKVRIAREDLQRQIHLAVITTEPFTAPNGDWVRRVTITDYVRGSQRTFQMRVNGPDDMIVGYAVSGLAQGIARDKISFEEYAYAAAETGKIKRYPSEIDGALSFAILKTKPSYDTQISAVLGKPQQTSDIEKQLILWEQLMDELFKGHPPDAR